jgi:hypothetical protein
MMRNIFIAVVFSSLLLSPVLQVTAQNSTGTQSPTTFDTTGFPQWAKDMRRWDIIAFGVFPFAMFTTTFFTDLFRWGNANSMSFTEEGRRYAPWPLKSAGAIEMTREEYERSIWIAVGLSAAIALADLIIVKIRQSRERRRMESIPSGSVIINRTPYGVTEEESESPGAGNLADTGNFVDIGESEPE